MADVVLCVVVGPHLPAAHVDVVECPPYDGDAQRGEHAERGGDDVGREPPVVGEEDLDEEREQYPPAHHQRGVQVVTPEPLDPLRGLTLVHHRCHADPDEDKVPDGEAQLAGKENGAYEERPFAPEEGRCKVPDGADADVAGLADEALCGGEHLNRVVGEDGDGDRDEDAGDDAALAEHVGEAEHAEVEGEGKHALRGLVYLEGPVLVVHQSRDPSPEQVPPRHVHIALVHKLSPVFLKLVPPPARRLQGCRPLRPALLPRRLHPGCPSDLCLERGRNPPFPFS
mmetsp:Transcript_752/g.1984  ORF Transcript_752/g.1984 Transcript_752/m.1984 type:complete len:284 (+) Transcript_752:808-1659(+)